MRDTLGHPLNPGLRLILYRMRLVMLKPGDKVKYTHPCNSRYFSRDRVYTVRDISIDRLVYFYETVYVGYSYMFKKINTLSTIKEALNHVLRKGV